MDQLDFPVFVYIIKLAVRQTGISKLNCTLIGLSLDGICMVKEAPDIRVVSCKSKQAIRALKLQLETLGFRASVQPLSGLSELLQLELGEELVLVVADSFDEQEISLLHTFHTTYQNKVVLLIDQLEEHFVRAVSRVCDEFIISPIDNNELLIRLSLVNKVSGKKAESEPGVPHVQRMIGKSAPFLNMLHKISMVSLVDIPVLIQGETGTGKELAARAVHYQSERRGYPFIPVNCGTLPDELLENELFGHEQGAYTDARRSHDGLVAQAEGGTLFLDEIETLSYKGQIALLRFLQEREFRPLGSKRCYKSDIRVISASNADLKQMVLDGDFREDLYFRLNVLPIDIPPLRERPGDVETLIDFYWQKFRDMYPGRKKSLSASSRSWMLNHSWPGNIRELENLLHREYILSDSDMVRIQPAQGTEAESGESTLKFHLDIHNYDFNTAKNEVITNFEKSYLIRLMDKCQGNVSQAARYAGKERRSLGKLLKKYGINRSNYL
jgi:DNA-binding NtrC family response regulator